MTDTACAPDDEAASSTFAFHAGVLLKADAPVRIAERKKPTHSAFRLWVNPEKP
jgi:hypothetical protein